MTVRKWIKSVIGIIWSHVIFNSKFFFQPSIKKMKSRDIQLKFFVYFMNQAIGVDKFRKHVVMLNCTYAFNFFEFGKFIRKMGYF